MAKKSELIGKEVYRIKNPEGRVMYSFIIDEGEKVLGRRKLTENLWNRLSIESQTQYLKQEYNMLEKQKREIKKRFQEMVNDGSVDYYGNPIPTHSEAKKKRQLREMS